jgi:hypothetical protein
MKTKLKALFAQAVALVKAYPVYAAIAILVLVALVVL